MVLFRKSIVYLKILNEVLMVIEKNYLGGYVLLRIILNKIKFILFKIKWKNQNKHNYITIKNIIPLNLVKVGKNSYGAIEVNYWGSNNEGLEIGNFVSIAKDVKFILGGNHEISTFTTYPFKVMTLKKEKEALSKGKIIVKDDVWIGMNSLILSGVVINQGAIVAAGSVITKDVPPYAIVGGNPAKILKYRFSTKMIEAMMKVDWEKVKIEKIEKVQTELYSKLNEEIYSKIVKTLIG